MQIFCFSHAQRCWDNPAYSGGGAGGGVGFGYVGVCVCVRAVGIRVRQVITKYFILAFQNFFHDFFNTNGEKSRSPLQTCHIWQICISRDELWNILYGANTCWVHFLSCCPLDDRYKADSHAKWQPTPGPDIPPWAREMPDSNRRVTRWPIFAQ
jgi:hypothetical protein